MKRLLAFALFVAVALSLCACAAPEKAIVGSWKNQTAVLGVVTETVYTFKEDGTGIISNVLDIEFTYSFSEDKLLIKTVLLGIENTEEYSYDFNGGKLVLTGESDTIELEKVK